MKKFAALVDASSTQPGASATTTPGATPTPGATKPAARLPGTPVPSFFAGEALPLRIAWTAEKEVPGKPPDFTIDAQSLALDGDRLWAFAQCTGYDAPAESCLLEIALPSFSTRVWPLPEGAVKTTSAASLLVEPERISLAKEMEFFGQWDRRTHEWKLYPDLLPSVHGEPVREKNLVYFLTGHPGETGLVQFDSATGRAVLLASNRRVPAVTPLDDPHASARLLSAAGGRLTVQLSAAATGAPSPKAGPQPPPQPPRIVMYDPATGAWTDFSDRVYPYPVLAIAKAGAALLSRSVEMVNPANVLAKPVAAIGVPTGLGSPGLGAAMPRFMPVTRPGAVYAQPFPQDGMALQLPMPEMPVAIFRVAPEPRIMNGVLKPTVSTDFSRWVWTPGGYVGARWYDSTALWYLPTATVEEYVKTHQWQPNTKVNLHGPLLRPAVDR